MRLKGRNDIFTIKDTYRNSTSFAPVTFITYSEKFVDVQIDLFLKTDSFPLRTFDCWYGVAGGDADLIICKMIIS